jgi:hypothetical protein
MSKPGGKLAEWPPAGYRGFYRVKTGESWQSVSLGYLVPDVWDLIAFNFRTENPREVNWYMHHYVGCWKSNDGKNFSFTDADPGFIYIPPFGWKRSSPGLPIGAAVADALSRMSSKFPYVTYKGFEAGPSDLLAIVEALRISRIQTVLDPALSGVVAQYSRYDNRMTVRTASVTGIYNQSTLVHEATHAILDMKRASGILRLDNEFTARAVESLFTYTADPDYADRRARDPGTDAIERAGLVLGHYMHTDGKSAKRLESYDREVTSFIDGSRLNPYLALQESIKHSAHYIKGEWWKTYRGSGI